MSICPPKDSPVIHSSHSDDHDRPPHGSCFPSLAVLIARNLENCNSLVCWTWLWSLASLLLQHESSLLGDQEKGQDVPRSDFQAGGIHVDRQVDFKGLTLAFTRRTSEDTTGWFGLVTISIEKVTMWILVFPDLELPSEAGRLYISTGCERTEQIVGGWGAVYLSDSELGSDH